MVEQVIAEDAVNYTVVTPDGKQLLLPKAFSKKITGDEAAVKLFAERKDAYNTYMGQLVREDEIVKQAKARIVEYAEALKSWQAKVAEYEQGLMLIATYLKAQQRNGQSSTAEMQQQLQLLQQLEDMSKRRDRPRAPNQNRYEVDVK